MRFTLQLVIHTDNNHETTVEDVMVLEKPAERIEHLGLTLAEAKQLLVQLQQRLLADAMRRLATAGSMPEPVIEPARDEATQATPVFWPGPLVGSCPAGEA